MSTLAKPSDSSIVLAGRLLEEATKFLATTSTERPAALAKRVAVAMLATEDASVAETARETGLAESTVRAHLPAKYRSTQSKPPSTPSTAPPTASWR